MCVSLIVRVAAGSMRIFDWAHCIQNHWHPTGIHFIWVNFVLMQKCAADQGQRQRAGQRRPHRVAPHQRPPATCLLARQRGTHPRPQPQWQRVHLACGRIHSAGTPSGRTTGWVRAGWAACYGSARQVGLWQPAGRAKNQVQQRLSELSTGAALPFSVVALRMHGTA